MAAIFIVAGIAIADKVEKKREARRRKKALDDQRYRELQLETEKRLASTHERKHSGAGDVIEHRGDDEDVREGHPPSYESVGGRRGEEEWWVAEAEGGDRRSVTSSSYGVGASTGTGAAAGMERVRTG